MDGITRKQKNKIIKSSPSSPYAYNIASYDENIRHLIGWPGYRTSNNKSGLDYLETRAEWAHMQGVMIRWMITGKFKTRNPIYLFLMTLFGIFQASPVLLFLSREGRATLLQNLLVFLVPILVGLLLLGNVILSLIKVDKGESITGD